MALKSLKDKLKLLCITCPRDDMSYLQQVELACQGGADMIQFRDKSLPDGKLLEISLQLQEICHKYDVLFTVNNRADIALLANSDGVHVGQKDIPASYARKILGRDKIIGVSASLVQEACLADKTDVDYIGHGAIFPTTTKLDARRSGLERLTEIKKLISKPLIAIGGIDLTNVADVIRAGADGVAVVSAVCGAKDIKKSAQDIKKIILQIQQEGNRI